MIRMPSKANPRMMSSVAMRSLIGSEPTVGDPIRFPLLAAEPFCGAKWYSKH
jgi:hypothetical protein